MGRRALGVLKYPVDDDNENVSVTASQFIEEVYDDCRDEVKGRSHSIIKDLKISIFDLDGSQITISERTVTDTVKLFKEKMSGKEPQLAEEIDEEIKRNLVRIDMVYNICKIIEKYKWNDRIGLLFKIYGQRDFHDEIGETAETNEEGALADHDFYLMIKHWMVSDHYNPTIRSEMIWDMLLSDFVCDMMRKEYDKKDEGKEIIMLAKEFPYSKKPYKPGGKDLKGPKVDYLVGIDNTLYFVELKTDLGSFNKTQRDAYLKYVNHIDGDGFSVSDLWNRYMEIVEKAGEGKNYYEHSGSEKYRYQLDKMKEVCGKKGVDDTSFLEDQKKKYERIRLTYITFDKIPGHDEIDQIVIRDGDEDNLKIFKLENEEDDEKRQRWFLVMDIIKEAMTEGMPIPIPSMSNG